MANDTKNNQENNQEIDFSKIDFDALEEEAMDHYEEQQQDKVVQDIDEEEVVSKTKKKDEEKEEELTTKKSKDEEVEQPKSKSKDDEEVKQETKKEEKQEEKNNERKEERKEEKMEEKANQNNAKEQEEVKHTQQDKGQEEPYVEFQPPLLKMVITQPRVWQNAFLKSSVDKEFEEFCKARDIKCRMGKEGDEKGKLILENVDNDRDIPELMNNKKFRKFLVFNEDKRGGVKLDNVKISHMGSGIELKDNVIVGEKVRVAESIRKDMEARMKHNKIDLSSEKTLKKNSEVTYDEHEGQTYERLRNPNAKAVYDFFETQASKGNPAKQVLCSLFAGAFKALADAEPKNYTVYGPSYMEKKSTQANDKYVAGMVEAMVGTTENPGGAVNPYLQLEIGQMIVDGDLKVNKQGKIEHTKASKKAMSLMDDITKKEFQMNINFLNAWGNNAELELAKYGQDNAKKVKDMLEFNLNLMQDDKARSMAMRDKDTRKNYRTGIASSLAGAEKVMLENAGKPETEFEARRIASVGRVLTAMGKTEGISEATKWMSKELKISDETHKAAMKEYTVNYSKESITKGRKAEELGVSAIDASKGIKDRDRNINKSR